MVPSFLKSIPHGDVIFAIAVLLISIAAAWVLYKLVRGIAYLTVRKTKTVLDDILLTAIEKPLYAYVVLAGLYIGLTNIAELANYQNVVRKSLIVILIGIIAYTVVRLMNGLTQWYTIEIAPRTATKLDETLLPIIRRVLMDVIYAIAIILMLDYLGINIAPLAAGLGIAGLALALALQSTLTYFLSSTYVATEGIVRVGDFIEVDEQHKGYVEEITWRATKIRTLQDVLMVVPNSKLADSMVMNYHLPDKPINVWLPCGVSYDSDLEKVDSVTREVIKKVLQEMPGGDKNSEPMVRFYNFGDSNIEFNIIFRVEDFRYKAAIVDGVIKQLTKRYREEGIEIAYPTRKIYFADQRGAGLEQVLSQPVEKNNSPGSLT